MNLELRSAGLLSLSLLLVTWVGCIVRAERIPIPNESFELPSTQYVSTRIESWQETPKPDDYPEVGGFLWDQLTGVFRNTPVTAVDHVFNFAGEQAIYLFSIPGVGLFQDYESVAYNQTEASHAFDAIFEVGRAYEFTAGIIGQGGNLPEGVGLELAFYHRNPQGAMVPVATLVVTNSAVAFPDRNHAVPYTVRLPPVQIGDPWAGRHMGVRILALVSDEKKGGYWVVDNVQVSRTALPMPAPVLHIESLSSNLRIRWPSAVGSRYRLQGFAELGGVVESREWVAGTGDELSLTVPKPGGEQHYYRLEIAPAP